MDNQRKDTEPNYFLTRKKLSGGGITCTGIPSGLFSGGHKGGAIPVFPSCPL